MLLARTGGVGASPAGPASVAEPFTSNVILFANACTDNRIYVQFFTNSLCKITLKHVGYKKNDVIRS